MKFLARFLTLFAVTATLLLATEVTAQTRNTCVTDPACNPVTPCPAGNICRSNTTRDQNGNSYTETGMDIYSDGHACNAAKQYSAAACRRATGGGGGTGPSQGFGAF